MKKLITLIIIGLILSSCGIYQSSCKCKNGSTTVKVKKKFKFCKKPNETRLKYKKK